MEVVVLIRKDFPQANGVRSERISSTDSNLSRVNSDKQKCLKKEEDTQSIEGNSL